MTTHKFIVSLLFILASALICTPTALAHGGFEKHVGNTTLYITQNPLSPLLGESITVTIIFRQDEQPLKNLAVGYQLIKTAYDHPELDQLQKTKHLVTDANGAINLTETFNTTDYYDLDFNFIEPGTNIEQQTGFLIQPRAQNRLVYSLAGLGIGIIGGFIVAKYTNLKRHA